MNKAYSIEAGLYCRAENRERELTWGNYYDSLDLVDYYNSCFVFGTVKDAQAFREKREGDGQMKLFDSERKVMEVLWQQGDTAAGQIVKILKEEIGWNRNTTYTVIKKCVDKGAIRREEPGFVCHALISRQEIQDYETEELIDKMFDGSKEKFFAAFLDGKKLSGEEVEQLKKMINDLS